MSLQLQLPGADEITERRSALFDQEEIRLRGETVLLKISFPDGSEKEIPCEIGRTVEYVKAKLEKETDISLTRMTLFYKGEIMPDPLSLNDFPIDPTTPCEITLELTTEAE